MSIESFLHDAPALAARLGAAVGGGRFFHACVVSGGTEAARERVAAALAAAAVCLSDTDRPCGKCSGCRKAAADEHPDIYHVRTPEDRRSIPVDAIRGLKTIMNIRPNEAPRRAILIHRAEELGPAGQNALLAMLEEPASDVLFELITENEQSLLETVRSRCAAVRLGASAEPEETDGPAAALVTAFTELCAAVGASAFSGARCALAEAAFALGKLKAAELAAELEKARAAFAARLAACELESGKHAREYDAAERTARGCVEYARANVSAGHVSGLLLAELLDIGGNL